MLTSSTRLFTMAEYKFAVAMHKCAYFVIGINVFKVSYGGTVQNIVSIIIIKKNYYSIFYTIC